MLPEVRMLRKTVLVITLTLLLAGQAWANADINFSLQGITQGAFKSFSRELGSALSYKNVAPAEPLGITGFDVGVEVTAVDITKEAAYWQAATNSAAPPMYYIPKVRARKGLPFGIDVGAEYSKVPDSNIQLIGAEVSKALLDGSAVTPALGVRATYTRLLGVGSLDLQTVGADATISKGFVIVTPYAGAGAVWIDSRAKGALRNNSLAQLGVVLADERLWQERFFGGVKLSPLPFFNVTGEVEYSGRVTYSLKASIGF
jgi:hypothetical protein